MGDSRFHPKSFEIQDVAKRPRRMQPPSGWEAAFHTVQLHSDRARRTHSAFSL